MTRVREERKLVRAFDASILDRRGYWGCAICTAHNRNTEPYCTICGATCWKRQMPTELISLGPVTAIVQNRIYALPVSRALLTCDTVAATFQHSNDVAFGVSAPLALSAAGEAEVGGGFIRCTSGNVNVSIKKS